MSLSFPARAVFSTHNGAHFWERFRIPLREVSSLVEAADQEDRARVTVSCVNTDTRCIKGRRSSGHATYVDDELGGIYHHDLPAKRFRKKKVTFYTRSKSPKDLQR